MTAKVLITGASGLIGSKVVEVLRAGGSGDPVALVRVTGTAPPGVEEIAAADCEPPSWLV